MWTIGRQFGVSMDELHNLMSVGKTLDMIMQKLSKMSPPKTPSNQEQELHLANFQGPATATGLEVRKGLFEPGFDADMVVWDPSVSKNKTKPHGCKILIFKFVGDVHRHRGHDGARQQPVALLGDETKRCGQTDYSEGPHYLRRRQDDCVEAARTATACGRAWR